MKTKRQERSRSNSSNSEDSPKRRKSSSSKGRKSEADSSKWDSPERRRSPGRHRNRDSSRDRNKRGERHDRRAHQREDRHDRYNDRRNRNYNAQRSPKRRRRSRSNSFDHSKAVWGKHDQSYGERKEEKPKEKEKPNFGLSGKLTEETNTYRGVVIKYSEPPEARKPKRRWRLYPFKGEKAMQTLYIHRESAYLIGRDRKVVDLPVDHPSCSKQHAALQYRLVTFTRDDGTSGKRVRPYLIDLDSANGTFINNKKIEPKKYVELLERDVIKFGFSSREYVLLHENSKDETQDDDVKLEDELPIKSEVKTEEE